MREIVFSLIHLEDRKGQMNHNQNVQITRQKKHPIKSQTEIRVKIKTRLKLFMPVNMQDEH